MAKWTPNDETHAARVLAAVAKDGAKNLKNKNHKLYKNIALAALVDVADSVVKVVNEHEATQGKTPTGKFVYVGTGVNAVVMAMASACVASMKKLGMSVPA